jgi:hypothetical protein
MCNADDTCGLHSENYYWCKIGNSWEYCGLVEWMKWQKQYKASWKRVLLLDDHEVVRDRFVDEAHHMEVYYISGRNIENTLPLKRELRESAYELIEKFSHETLSKHPGRLVRNDNWRLDMQGITTADQNGQEHYNLQLQLNIHRRGPKHSTTYAAVLVPVQNAVNDNYIRQALEKSLDEEILVKIEVKKRRPPHRTL